MNKKTYGPKEVCKLVNISARQLGYWKLIGVVRPRQELHGSKIFHRYTEHDLELLKAVRKLTHDGYLVSKAAEKIKAALALGEELSPQELLALASPRTPSQLDQSGAGTPAMEAFQKRLTEEVARAHRFHFPLSCLVIKVEVSPADHEDAMRRAVDDAEQILTSSKRAFDVFARVGRQEFLWLLCQTPAEGAQAAAGHVRKLLDRRDFTIGGKRYSIRLRIGASCIESGADDGASLIERARAALDAGGLRNANAV